MGIQDTKNRLPYRQINMFERQGAHIIDAANPLFLSGLRHAKARFAGEHEAALAEFQAIPHSLLQVYSKFTAPPLCLIHGARGGHGQALARWAPAGRPAAALRHRPHRRGLRAGGGGGGGGRRRAAGWGLPGTCGRAAAGCVRPLIAAPMAMPAD